MRTLSITFFLLTVLLVDSVRAQSARIVLVTAGYDFKDIATLSERKAVLVCPAMYPEGISLRCDGSEVKSPVGMSANGGYMRWEGRAPFHIAGDRDIGGLTHVFPWTKYRGMCNSHESCQLTIMCRYATASGARRTIERPLIIEPSGCEMKRPAAAVDVYRMPTPEDPFTKCYFPVGNKTEESFVLTGGGVSLAYGAPASMVSMFGTDEAVRCANSDIRSKAAVAALLKYAIDTCNITQTNHCATALDGSCMCSGSRTQLFDCGIASIPSNTKIESDFFSVYNPCKLLEYGPPVPPRLAESRR